MVAERVTIPESMHIDNLSERIQKDFMRAVKNKYNELIKSGVEIEGVSYDTIPKYDEEKQAFTLTATFTPAHAH